jgi:hypothetical protein
MSRRRSNRTSLRYVVGSATSGASTIVCTTVSLLRSMQTSFGPPVTVSWNSGDPVSSTQSRSSGSTTMLCTDTNAFGSSLPDGVFQPSSGNGTATPSRSSATVNATSSPHLG